MVERLLTTHSDQGICLDQFLQQQLPNLSPTRIRKIIDIGGVHLDGQRIRKCGRTIQPWEEIELYQDKYIIVTNKPAGIDTQPTPARFYHLLHLSQMTWL
jgi:23S rRNA pseudouridine1911/1915/1917 synthase